MAYGCIRFVGSYRFLSSSLYLLVKTLVNNSHETNKNLENEIVDNDEILNFVNELGEEDRTIEDLKKDYPDKIEELEEGSLIYICENDLKNSKKDYLIGGSI